MAITRRALLRTGVAGTALLAVGGVGLSLQSSVLREPVRPLKSLDLLAYSVLVAAADRICPAHRDFPAASALDVAGKVDLLLAQSAPLVQEQFRSVMALLENAVAGLLLSGNPRPFTASSPAMQDAVLEHWRQHRVATLRGAHKAIRALVVASYYADPAVYALVGYPGPPNFRGESPAEAQP